MTTSHKKFKVGEKEGKQRLDVFLAEKMAITRSQVQKLIGAKTVLINGKLPKKAGDRLAEGDVVEYLKDKDAETKNKSDEKIKDKKDKDLTKEIRIIEETPDYIVVEKPAGLLTHPTMAQEKESLSGFLAKKFPEIKKVGEDPLRPGIVHRLDKEASGLLVVARTQKMFNYLKEQFKNRTIDKEYLVLAHGRFERNWGEINFPLKRSEKGERMAAVPRTGNDDLTDEAKEAKTEFTVEKTFVNYALLRIKIYTGRMHQIRAHLLAYNHPVVGDGLYFQKKQNQELDKKLGRLFLHCTKLVFTGLDGVRQEYNSPLPQAMADFLGLIK